MHHELDKGLIRLINQKLDHGNTLKEIRDMLYKAGVSKNSVERALLKVHPRSASHHKNSHDQSIIDKNDFLPPLNKSHRKSLQNELVTDLYGGVGEYTEAEEKVGVKEVLESPVTVEAEVQKIIHEEITHKGLFVGRLRRKDFIIGILFFFGLAFIYFTALIYLLQTLSPKVWQSILYISINDPYSTWLIFMPFVFAPITIIIISLITRRLHNLELPGFIAWFYLVLFIVPPEGVVRNIIIALDIALLVLFIVMLSKKGHPAQNKHGKLPHSHGSFFHRILGYEHLHFK